MGGGIGVPPMLETMKQLDAKKIAVLGYRDELFLNEEFEKNGEVYIATEDGSAGTKGNVMDAIRGNDLEADVIFACGPKPMLRAIKAMHWRRESPAGFPWKSAWHVVSVPALAVYASPQKRMPIRMYTISAYVKTVRCSEVRRWSYEQNERKSCRSDSEKSSNDCIWNIWFRCGI